MLLLGLPKCTCQREPRWQHLPVLGCLVFIHSHPPSCIYLCAFFTMGMGKSLDFPIYVTFQFAESSPLEVLAPMEDGRGVSD